MTRSASRCYRNWISSIPDGAYFEVADVNSSVDHLARQATGLGPPRDYSLQTLGVGDLMRLSLSEIFSSAPEKVSP